MKSLSASHVTIRPSRPEDLAQVRRLAALDSAPTPRGPLLLGEVDGHLLAAVSLEDGRTVADPFAPTAFLVELLRVRRDRSTTPGGRRPFRGAPRRLAVPGQ